MKTYLKIMEKDVPARSKMISWVEFIDQTGAHPTRLGELIDLGWLDPVRTSEDSYLFRVVDVYRVRKLERICSDFDLSSQGGSIVVDLLIRIEQLEEKIRQLEELQQR